MWRTHSCVSRRHSCRRPLLRLSHFGAQGLAFLWGRRFRLPTDSFTASDDRGSDWGVAHPEAARNQRTPVVPSGTLNRSNVDRAAGQVLALPVICHVKLTPFGSSCNRAAESAGGQFTCLESTLRAWVSDTGRDAAGGLRHTDRRGGALPDLQLLWERGP